MAIEMSKIVAAALLLTSTAAAAPAHAVRLSSPQIRKGQPIKIYLDITAGLASKSPGGFAYRSGTVSVTVPLRFT
jgi:hypothetical protein